MRTMIVTVALLLVTAGLSWGQPGPQGGRRQGRLGLGNADLNGDGKVDQAEAEQGAKQRLEAVKAQLERVRQQFDANGDGALDDGEKAALQNKLAEGGNMRQAKMLAAVDKDGDWKLSAGEEADALKMMTERSLQAGGGEERGRPGPQDPDSNGDCIIDDTEARVAAEHRIDMTRRIVERLAQRAQDNPDMRYPGMLAEIDVDRNYDISDAEAKAAVERQIIELQKRNEIVLKYYDTDQDGELNDTERAAAKTAFEFMKEVGPTEGALGRMGQGGPGLGGRGLGRPGGPDGPDGPDGPGGPGGGRQGGGRPGGQRR